MARYMMATKAVHKLGDVSGEEPDLCSIHREDKENYIGSWVLGIILNNVKFPKSTTRELTDEEKKEWHGKQIWIGGRPRYTIYIK
ncbi:MAG: hypothetical protein UU96_C0015G0003 [Parcubacteria group bacterium GW2011_GWC2_42_13]|nr:MAG: hypothetical protein UU96_C0015G0003 [Parcubacteria group bacterium GW2011_GWC2_42_13]